MVFFCIQVVKEPWNSDKVTCADAEALSFT